MAFINNLESILEIKHISQIELCNSVDIAKSSLSMWAKGSIPKVDTAFKIAEYLGVTVEYLMTGKEPSLENYEMFILAKLSQYASKDALDLAKRIDALPDDMKDIVLATLEACERHK